MGPLTVYGPTMAETPDAVYRRRREVRAIPAGRTFLREGEIPDTILTLYSGWAFRFKQTRDGRRQILSFLLPGDTLVLENLCFPHFPLPFSVRSLTPVAACIFLLDDMIEIMQATKTQAAKLADTRQRYMACVHERQLDLGRRTAMGRTARLLLELEYRLQHRKLVRDGAFEFPVRQEHMADALGLTTVYVNRTLVALRKRGIIAFDRQQMAIRDPDELRRIAEEE